MTKESRNAYARIAIGTALLLTVMGSAISFMPGSEVWWFGMTATLAACGFMAANWRLKVIAGVLAIALLWPMWQGYHRGLEYREWLGKQDWLRQP